MAGEAIGARPEAILDRAVLVSVMARVGCEQMSAAAGHRSPVVRAMPNTPVMVNQGCTGLFSTTFKGPAKREWLRKLFAAVGIAVRLEQEGQLDTVTVISGSGPADYHLFSEALADAGVALGLPPELARQLNAQAARGTAELQCKPQADFVALLRKAVTSLNGATAAATDKLESQDSLRRLVKTAAKAAYDRSIELSMQS